MKNNNLKLIPIIDYNTAITLIKKNSKRIINIKIFKNNKKTKIISKLLEKKKINYSLTKKNIIKKFKIKQVKNNGFIIFCKKKNIKKIEKYKNKKKSSFIICDKIESSGNFGRIIRYSVIFGIKNILIKNKDKKKINYITEKASVGTINNINIYKTKSIEKAILELKKKKFYIIGLHQDGKNIKKKNSKKKKIAFIIGNEIKGLKKKTKLQCNSLLRINTKKKIPLNASDSILIAIYEYFNNI